jgi:hypothetical protein
MGMGTATLILKEPNLLSGKYNPRNSSSPLFGKLKPGKPLRIRAIHNSITYPIFFGYISLIDYRPESYESVIIAQDAFSVLNRVDPTIGLVGGANTQFLLWTILEACSIPESFRFPAIGTNGDKVPLFSSDGTSSGLTIASNLLKVERGNLFVGRDGIFVYNPRGFRNSGAAPFAMPNGVTITPRGSVDAEKIRNRASAARTGGIPQVYQDNLSVDEFGPADIDNIVSDYLNSDEQALSLAGHIVNRKRGVISTVWDARLVLNTTDALMVAGLGRELDNSISVSEVLAVGNFWVESIEHSVSEGGKLHEMLLGLSEKQGSDDPFKIGTSTINGPQGLVWGSV